MIDSNDALIDEFQKKDCPDKALFYTIFMIYDTYYTMNKPEWINQENKEYRRLTERRFAEYFKKHKKMWNSVPESDKMQVSNAVRSRTVMEGMSEEQMTMKAWLKYIEKLGRKSR
jgi:hypothetical protein